MDLILKDESIPEHIESRIDYWPDHIGCDQVEKFTSGIAVISDHQENPHRDGEQEGGDKGNSRQSVFLFDSYYPPVFLCEDLFMLLFIFLILPFWYSEGLIPPGDQLSGQKGKKVDSCNSSYIGP